MLKVHSFPPEDFKVILGKTGMDLMRTSLENVFKMFFPTLNNNDNAQKLC